MVPEPVLIQGEPLRNAPLHRRENETQIELHTILVGTCIH